MCGYVLVGLEVFLNVLYAVFNLVAVVDVQVSGHGVLAFIDLDHRAQQLVDAAPALERRRHHWHADELLQCVEVRLVTAALKLVEHI